LTGSADFPSPIERRIPNQAGAALSSAQIRQVPHSPVTGMEMRGTSVLGAYLEHSSPSVAVVSTGTLRLLMPVHYKLAALEAGLHFPRVVGVDPLRSTHCFTRTVLGHRRCLLRAADKSIRESFALGCSLSLQPNIHAGNYPITRGSEHEEVLSTR